MDRRNFLFFGGASLALAACSPVVSPAPVVGPPAPPTGFDKAQAIARAIGAAVGPLVTAVATAAGVSPATAQRWAGEAAAVSKIANDVLATPGVAAAGPLPQRFETAAVTLLDDLATSKGLIPVSAQNAINDIDTLLPVFLAIFNLVGATGRRTARLGSSVLDDLALQNLRVYAGR